MDKNNKAIEIGDIVRIEGSPNKSDNATYIVYQDGTSDFYSGSDLTLYRVAKHKNGYSISRSSYNICFYPLVCYSNKYKYTREELDAATIEILVKNDPSKVKIEMCPDNWENDCQEGKEKDLYFHVSIETTEGKKIEDASYLCSQVEKLQQFLSNITLKADEEIKIVKACNTDLYYHRSEYVAAYKAAFDKVTEQAETESADVANLTFEVLEDTDTRTNEKIYLVKVAEKLSREEYVKVHKYIKSLGGYYSKFKHAFLFKEDPTMLLNISRVEIVTKAEDKPTEDTETATEESQQEETKQTINYNITEDTHTKTGAKIWLVKPDTELSKQDFAEVKRKLATLRGFYSSLKHGFVFKYDPTEKMRMV